MSSRCTRRGFMKGTLAAAALTALSRGPYILSAAAPSSKLGVAVIGSRGMGGYSLDCSLHENLIAFAEIDDQRIAETFEEIKKKGGDNPPKPKVYFDYRRMLEECDKDIDVVLIATPDHHHAPAGMRAINLGKHTFIQKPLAHNINECYALARAAREKKVLTNMGNQGQYGEGMRRLAEYVFAGAVGNIKESHTILGRNFGGSGGRPPSKPIPKGLHWDEWIGPAPYRDYHDHLHPFDWRSWRQFGTGTIGDMACHNVNPVWWALNLRLVKRFTVECINQKGGSEEMFPQDNILRFEIPARDQLPKATCYVYDHEGLKPDVMKQAEIENNRKFGEYTLFIGEKGMIGSDSRILPESKHKEFQSPLRYLPRAHGGPIEDLYYCIKNGGTPAGNFQDAAAPLTAFVLTGHLAMFAGVGKKVEWNVEQMRCTNMPELNQYVRREYRPGWEI